MSAIETRSLPGEPRSASPRAALLVVTAGSSRRVVLPDSGAFIAGRADDADLTIEDAAISRYHARFTCDAAAVTVTDQGSHNGTLVNGVRIGGPQRLVSGDVVRIGEATLILHGAAQPDLPARLLDADQLTERLDHELDRAVRFERPLWVVVLTVARADDAPALEAAIARGVRLTDVAGWLEPTRAMVLLPEQDADERDEVIARIRAAAPPVQVGSAGSPTDGSDRSTLIEVACARASSDGAGPRAPIQVGDREVLIGCAAMERIFDLLRRLAAGDIPVLIAGETGVGKENAAYAVHAWSRRAGGPFVPVNCAAIQDTLIESELFGYKKGAFSGATTDKPGLLEAADGGTVFLDEVGELSLAAQAKLLRVLEAGELTRVGDVESRKVDFRVVAATNRDLEAEVSAGRFRQDLMFRLNTAQVVVPPLRERRGEIPLLSRAFAAIAAARMDRDAPEVSDDALRALSLHRWPGNVRELRNAIDYAVTASAGDRVEVWHLPDRVRADDAATGPDVDAMAGAFRPIAEEVADLERRRMVEALEAAGGVQAKAARLIAMPRRTFTMKLRKYGIKS